MPRALSLDLFLTSPGFETALLAEAGRGHTVSTGLVAMEPRPLTETDYVFARQVLPEAIAVCEPSVERLADAVATELIARADQLEVPLTLHVFVGDVDHREMPALSSRATLLERTLTERLRFRRRRLHRRLTIGPGGVLIQVLLAEPSVAWLSVDTTGAPSPPIGAGWPVRFPAGRASVPIDRTAPSTAYLKLAEAFAWMDRPPRAGEVAVDLGASPGGWTHVAVQHGMRVISVDRAPLAPELMAHPSVAHTVRDAFRFHPPEPVDWLVCDVIAAPDRSLALLSEWTASRRTRRLVLHLKFKGELDYGRAQEPLAILAESGYGYRRVKHLYHDKNEVTVLASLSPEGV